MRVTFIATGRLKAGQEAELAARYIDRMAKAGPAIGIEFARTVELTESRAQSSDQRKSEEAAELEKNLPKGAFLVLLDERGKTFDSVEFAERLGQIRDDGQRARAADRAWRGARRGAPASAAS